MERRIRSFVRWNAMAMVVQANRKATELGGHIASFASARRCSMSASTTSSARPTTTRRATWCFPGALGPGVYARAFLEGRISEEQLNNFRQEVDGGGLSSYPHPG